MKQIVSLKDIINKYDYFLVDLNGIIWNCNKEEFEKSNKIEIFDWINNTLSFIYNNNKKIIFISNLRKTSKDIKNLLVRSGLYKDYIENMVTSADSLLMYINEKVNSVSYKYIYIAPETNCEVVDKNTNYIITENINEADFIITRGFEIKDFKKDFYFEKFNIAIKSKKPLFFINPDKESKAGLETFNLRRMNLDENENVIGFGKPYVMIYNQIFQKFNIKNKSRVISIGDRLHTDVLGAKRVGIDCLFVLNGKMKNDLKCNECVSILDKISNICKKNNFPLPKYVIENFTI